MAERTNYDDSFISHVDSLLDTEFFSVLCINLIVRQIAERENILRCYQHAPQPNHEFRRRSNANYYFKIELKNSIRWQAE